MPYPAHHKQQTRERILKSARHLFNKKGFAEVTIDEIVAAAELTRGVFYRYFKTKDELYSDALMQFRLQKPAGTVAAQARRSVRGRRDLGAHDHGSLSVTRSLRRSRRLLPHGGPRFRRVAQQHQSEAGIPAGGRNDARRL
jgi:AcrR family transcriptional regulator